jgi:hypothetical protein
VDTENVWLKVTVMAYCLITAFREDYIVRDEYIKVDKVWKRGNFYDFWVGKLGVDFQRGGTFNMFWNFILKNILNIKK